LPRRERLILPNVSPARLSSQLAVHIQFTPGVRPSRAEPLCNQRFGLFSYNEEALPKLYGADQSAQARREEELSFPQGGKREAPDAAMRC
jgi:hypothetical protein